MPLPPAQFPTTEWSAIIAIQSAKTDGGERDKIDQFCRSYWQPVFQFVKSLGVDHEDAEDVTQNIFSSVGEPETLSKLDPAKGRLRHFLKAVARNKSDEFRRFRMRQKRGGGQAHVPLTDEIAAEKEGFNFDRDWAMRLLEKAAETLRAEYEKRGRGTWFDVLFPHLTSGESEAVSYRQLAKKLDATESSVKVATHRMRQKYQTVLRKEVARTVENPDDVDEELRTLFDVLGGK